jgi:hypothetical protein
MHSAIDARLWLLTQLHDLPHLAAIHKGAMALAFAAFVACALSAWRTRPPDNSRWRRFFVSDFGFAFFLTAFVLAGRWPGLLAPELNVDESLFLAGAQKLQHDVVYWRSVDVGTSGPLNVYPLILPALFGFKLEYAGARGIGLLLVIATCLGLYVALLKLYGTRVARTALVPVVTTYALMTANDYVHYSSEHVPVALISVALCLACRLASSGASGGNITIMFIGLLLGAAPYAKLQATPIAAAVGCICLHVIWTRRSSTRQAVKRALAIGLGSASFSVVHLAFLIANSLQETFLRSYVLQNLYYSKFSTSIVDKAMTFVHVTVCEQDSRALFGLTAATLLAGVPLLFGCRRKSAADDERHVPPRAARTSMFLYYGLALLAASVYAVAQPQRPFYHYALFLIVPSGFLLGVVLGELQQLALRRPTRGTPGSNLVRLAATGFVAVSLLPAGTALLRTNRFLDGRNGFVANYFSPAAAAIMQHASPGASMAVWGWAPKLHVETGVVQATSDAVPLWQSRPNPQHDFFVRRFAKELRESKAKLFVEMQDPQDRLYHWLGSRSQRFEEVPEIAEIVLWDFTVVSRVDGVTIYARQPEPATRRESAPESPPGRPLQIAPDQAGSDALPLDALRK